MSCACLNKELGSELERIRRLAKAYARMEQSTVVIVKNTDGTYSFCLPDADASKSVIEYISKY